MLISTLWSQIHTFEIKADYSQDYIEENKGKYRVEVPEVYELANICISISDFGLNSSRVYKQGEYYKRVMEYFTPFKNHPMITEINNLLQNPAYFRPFKENSACFIFKDDSIIPGSIYPIMKYPNLFKRFLDLLEDFSRKSNFRKFYKENNFYYENQILKYKEKVPIKKMWLWLEKQFPLRYDCYKIIFSPLTYGSHMTQNFKGRNFKEIVMFISGPDIYTDNYDGIIEEALLSRLVFTEIDHNYVNPITDENIDRVKKIFADVKKWNQQSGYNSPYATFNEYMTWAVFLIYAYENYEKEDYEKIKQIVEKQMIESRKFILFDQFSERLLDLYLKSNKGQKIPDLYSDILDWARSL